MKTILLTGAAGFIGAWTAQALRDRGDRVVGVDNFNPYYDVRLKRNRVKSLVPDIPIHEVDIADRKALGKALKREKIDQICHLAAQAGVRYSLTNPFAYENANNLGTLNLLELARERNIRSIIYASSSSVYGANKKIPFSVDDPVNRPVSLYAATKRSNELTAHAYHHLYGIRCTGLRFFTVYGPWGRPDMAYFSFTKAIVEGRTIDVFNHGRMRRDFTYISDIVSGVLAALDKNHSYEIFNLGNCHPVSLTRFISAIESALGKKAKRRLLPLQPGDVPATWADIKRSTRLLGFRPTTDIQTGVNHFVDWYRTYFRI
ncbi:MAG: NAD-dependent epimerase/dehydratase family protein [Elusimicrobia bacterium]|jgi:UDP-glucuronate 4-epimerase|nr:NAD-dependent epimerase/dehydratase family protein [Elusimicrobiota bacterium]